MRLYKRCILPLIYLLACQVLGAQQVKQFSFKHFSTREGLASNNIRCSIQDELGFIWIGTADGLQRFDGTRFLTFRHESKNPLSLPANAIGQLMLDRQKRIWIMFDNGNIGLFDPRRFTYHDVPVKIGDQRSLRADKEIYHDLDGNILFLLKGIGLFRYSSHRDAFIAADSAIGTPRGWRIFTIAADTVSRRYWIGGDSGLAVYDPASRQLSTPSRNTLHDPVIEKHGKLSYIYNIFVDAKRRLWLERWPPDHATGYLYCLEFRSATPLLYGYTFLPMLNKYHEPRNLVQQRNGSLWIKGLSLFGRFDEQTRRFSLVENDRMNAQGIAYDVVNDLHEDREHNMWVSTSNNGLFLLDPDRQFFNVVPHMDRQRNIRGTGAVMSFAYANNGTILAGTWSNGLYRYDSVLNPIPVNIQGLKESAGYSIWSMCRLHDNRTIWMTMQPGVCVYDQVSNTAKVYNPAILENHTVRQVVEDPEGNIWIGLQNRGLYKWLRDKAAKEGFEKGFVKMDLVPNTNIHRLVIDSQGFLWVSTAIDGAYRIDPARDQVTDHFTTNGAPGHRLLDNACHTLLPYNDTTMVISAGGLNLYNTRTREFRYITVEDGLPSDMVVSMEKDNDQNLWLGMMSGLCRLNLSTMHFSYYNRNDGLVNDEFVMAASRHLPDGRLLFGTIEDFVVFDPANIKSSVPPPDAVITGMKLTDNPLPLDSLLSLPRIELPYYHNSLQVAFSGLSFQNREKVSYYYKLEGLDKEWKKADELHQATYSYLPPNNYLFLVKIRSADGLESIHDTTVRIRIKPPFWRTWWFVSLLAFAALSLFLYMDRLRISRLRDIIKMRTRIATNFAKDLGSTLGTINVLSEMAKVKADQDSERTKEYMNQISDNSSRMMEVMDDIIFSIKPENDELQHTIARMSHFAADLHAKYDVEIHFDLGEKVRDIRLRMDQRHELYAIFKEALTNAAKHSQAKYIDVTLACHKSRLRLRIQDEGKGFDVEALSFGRGLNDMQNKASGLHAKLAIQSEINTGTIIQLDMPIG